MDVAYQLDCEWSLLAQTEIARALRRWHEQQPQLRRFGTPRQLLCFLHSAPAEQTDGPLLALLALARYDQLARRTLLQVLLPALKTQAERMASSPSCLREEVWEVLLYFAWETICGYPVERRRVCVATKLVLDVLHNATRELHRQPAGSDESDRSGELRWLLPPEPTREDETPAREDQSREPVAPPEPVPPETVVLEGVAAGVLGRLDAELILLTRVDGIRLRLLARTVGASYHALRQRRQRAEKRLREFLESDRDVSKRPVSTLVSYEGTVFLPECQRTATATAIDVFAERAA
jgi:DNA-directed RNA polymerase specialized sigma24 family protein